MTERKPEDNTARWYVMTHLEMKRFQAWLEAENARRLGSGMTMIEPFFPHDFLNSNPDKAKSADLSRFVFLKATEADIESMVESSRNEGYIKRLRYYLDTDGRRAIVPDKMMQDFLEACIHYRGYFEIVPPIRSIEAMDKVRINTGPFAGYEASVTNVRHAKGAIHLELSIQLLSGVMNIQMRDVSKHQVTILNRDTTEIVRSDFIDHTQNHLLLILEHRIKRIEDEKVNRHDAYTLTRLYRYRNHEVKNQAAQNHLLALMLICAHLCRYTADEAELREKVLSRLADINRRSESKAATDTRTYLLIALYVSTHDPAYRDAVKQYVRVRQPKSPKLLRFVSLIRSGKKV